MAVIKLEGSRRIAQLSAGSNRFRNCQPKTSLLAQSGAGHE
jgi:hypothetical protein